MSDDKIKEIREKLERLTGNIALVSREMQRRSDRADEAWAEVDKLRAENERLREALIWYADPRNHFPVERRNSGDPDPAVIFVKEPPIMSDGGTRARNALAGKTQP